MPNGYYSDFLCDLIVELPTFSQSLVTFLVIIFVSLPLIFPHFGYHFCTLIFAKSGDWLVTNIFSTLSDDCLILNSYILNANSDLKKVVDVATCVIFCSILQFLFIVLRLYQLTLLLLFPNIIAIPGKQKQNIKNSAWLPKLMVNPSGFSRLTGQMLSEIRVGKRQKCAPPQYVLKSESDEIVKK